MAIIRTPATDRDAMPLAGSDSPRSFAVATATAARIHAARLRLQQAHCGTGMAVDQAWTLQLWRALAWLGALVSSALIAACCVAPVWVLPSAVLLTAGMWLISCALSLARRMRCRSLWWRCCWWMRRQFSADNLCRLLFAAGTLWSVWTVGGFDRLLARWSA